MPIDASAKNPAGVDFKNCVKWSRNTNTRHQYSENAVCTFKAHTAFKYSIKWK